MYGGGKHVAHEGHPGRNCIRGEEEMRSSAKKGWSTNRGEWRDGEGKSFIVIGVKGFLGGGKQGGSKEENGSHLGPDKKRPGD